MMKLDLRKPTLVLAGVWNPAIFKPAWIAQRVFGHPSGAEVPIAIVEVADGQPSVILFISGVGLAVSSARLEFFAVEASQLGFDAVEQAATRTVELLPHTPITAYGVNFRFVQEQPSPHLLEKLRGKDALETVFNVTRERIISNISLDLTTELTISRTNKDEEVIFDFNFHRSGIATEALTKELVGEIERRLEQARSVMRDIYDLSSFEVQKYEFDLSKAGEGADADDSA